MTTSESTVNLTGDPQSPDGFRLAFSPVEVAAALGISRELVDDLIRTGQLRSIKAGRRRLISRKALAEFLADDPEPAALSEPDSSQPPPRLAVARPGR